MEVIVYHNEACRLSLKVLTAIREAGLEPHVIDCEKVPPARRLLRKLAKNTGLPMREFLRMDDPLYGVLRLDDPRLSDEDLIDAMEDHPSLIAAPIVVTQDKVRLCRTEEQLAELLPRCQRCTGAAIQDCVDAPFRICVPNLNFN
jgi:arsenate reductase